MVQKFSTLYERELPRVPNWIAGGVLPKGGILLMGGEAKIGKTFLLLDMAEGLASATSLWGTEICVMEEATTLYIEQEVGEHELQRRLRMRYRSVPPGNLYYTSKVKDFLLDTPTGKQALIDLIRECAANVVIIDPISKCMIADENSNREVNRLFLNLDEVCGTFPGLSIVIAHHFGKPPKIEQQTLDPLSPYNFRGAAKWFDNPDSLITAIKRQPKHGEWKRLRIGFEVRQGEPIPPLTLAILEGGIVQVVPNDNLPPGSLLASPKLSIS